MDLIDIMAKNVRIYVHSLDSSELRRLLRQPMSKWAYHYLGEDGSPRCLVGHVLGNKLMNCYQRDPMSIETYAMHYFDDLCSAAGIVFAVKTIQSTCEIALKMRGEGTVEMEDSI